MAERRPFTPPTWQYLPGSVKRAQEEAQLARVKQQVQPLVEQGDGASLAVARSLVQYEKRGQETQGVQRIAKYRQRIGQQAQQPQPEVSRETGFGLGDVADAFRSVVPQGVRNAVGGALQDVSSFESAANRLIAAPHLGFEPELGTKAVEGLRRVPGVGGALATALDVGAAPLSIGSAAIKPGQIAARGIGRAIGNIAAVPGQNFRTRIASQALAGVTGEKGAELAQAGAERAGLGETGQTVAGLAGGLAGGAAGFGVVGAARGGRAAAAETALREAQPEAFQYGRGVADIEPQGLPGSPRRQRGAALPEDLIPRQTVVQPGGRVAAGQSGGATPTPEDIQALVDRKKAEGLTPQQALQDPEVQRAIAQVYAPDYNATGPLNTGADDIAKNLQRARNVEARLPQAAPDAVARDLAIGRDRVAPEGVTGDGTYRVFHGTSGDRVESIRGGGLNAPQGTGPGWFMVTTNADEAAGYAGGQAGGTHAGSGESVIEYRIPIDKVREYLTNPVASNRGNVQGLLKPIPGEYIVDVRPAQAAPEAPQGPRALLSQFQGGRIGAARVKLEGPGRVKTTMGATHDVGPNEVHIGQIEVPVNARKRGQATRAMDRLVAAADETGTTLTLEAYPFGAQPRPTFSDLVQFYERYGFDFGERLPNGEPRSNMARRAPAPASAPEAPLSRAEQMAQAREEFAARNAPAEVPLTPEREAEFQREVTRAGAIDAVNARRPDGYTSTLQAKFDTAHEEAMSTVRSVMESNPQRARALLNEMRPRLQAETDAARNELAQAQRDAAAQSTEALSQYTNTRIREADELWRNRTHALTLVDDLLKPSRDPFAPFERGAPEPGPSEIPQQQIRGFRERARRQLQGDQPPRFPMSGGEGGADAQPYPGRSPKERLRALFAAEPDADDYAIRAALTGEPVTRDTNNIDMEQRRRSNDVLDHVFGEDKIFDDLRREYGGTAPAAAPKASAALNGRRLETEAVREFGVTDDPRSAGYVLRDGRMLDLSEGGGMGRSADHRAVDRLPSMESLQATDQGSSWEYMQAFQEATGALRYMPEGHGVDIVGNTITDAQFRQLQRLITARRAKPLDIDFTGDRGLVRATGAVKYADGLEEALRRGGVTVQRGRGRAPRMPFGGAEGGAPLPGEEGYVEPEMRLIAENLDPDTLPPVDDLQTRIDELAGTLQRDVFGKPTRSRSNLTKLRQMGELSAQIAIRFRIEQAGGDPFQALDDIAEYANRLSNEAELRGDLDAQERIVSGSESLRTAGGALNARARRYAGEGQGATREQIAVEFGITGGQEPAAQMQGEADYLAKFVDSAGFAEGATAIQSTPRAPRATEPQPPSPLIGAPRTATPFEPTAAGPNVTQQRPISTETGAPTRQPRIAGWGQAVDPLAARGPNLEFRPISGERRPPRRPPLLPSSDVDLPNYGRQEGFDVGSDRGRPYVGLEEPIAQKPPRPDVATTAGDVINLPRSLVSTLDVSGIARQMAKLGVRNPAEYRQAIADNFAAIRSADDAKRVYDGLMNDPRAWALKKMKVAILDYTAKDPNLREENFVSQIPAKMAESNIPGVRQYGQLSEATNRGYVTGLNSIRGNVALKWIKGFSDDELRAMPDEWFEQIGSAINAFSGRGDLPKFLQDHATSINAGLFSPRFVASTFQAPLSVFSKNAVVRKNAAQSLAAFYGTGLALLGLAATAGLDVGVEPTASDFGKITLPGGTTIDIWGGQQQVARMLANLATGKVTSATTGDEYEQGRGETMWNFLKSKAAPVPRFALTAAGQNQNEERLRATPESLGNAALDLITPLFIQDTVDAMRNVGLIEGTIAGVGGAVGLGTNTPQRRAGDEEAEAQFGQRFSELDSTQKASILSANPELQRRQLEESQFVAGDRGRAAQAQLNTLAQQQASDDELLAGRLSVGDWKQQRNERRTFQRGQLEAIYGDGRPITAEQAAKDPKMLFLKILQDATDPATGAVDDVQVAVARAKLGPGTNARIDQSMGGKGTALERQYQQAAAKYYDVPKYNGYSVEDGDLIDRVFDEVSTRAATMSGDPTLNRQRAIRQLQASGELQGVPASVIGGVRRRIAGSLKESPRRKQAQRDPQVAYFFGSARENQARRQQFARQFARQGAVQ